jgi:hypothetical protein
MDKLLKEVKVGDEVVVSFRMKVDSVTSGKKEGTAQLFGFTSEGMCVSAPLDAVQSVSERPL